MLNGIEAPSSCLAATKTQIFQPQAEDILTDEDLLDLFRIVKQVLRKKPDSERLSKLLFCMSYALGDHVKFCKPLHEDCIIFRDDSAVPMVYAVKLPSSSSCCDAGSAYPDSSSQRNTSSLGPLSTHEDTLARSEKDSIQKWIESSSAASPHSPDSSLTRLPSVSYLTHGHSNASLPDIITVTDTNHHHEESTPTNPFSVRPYTNFRPLYNNNNNSTNLNTSSALSGTQSIPSPTSTATNSTRQGPLVTPNDKNSNNGNNNVGLESNSPDMVDRYAVNSIVQPTSLPNAHNPPTVVMEPQQRGFYYQDGRIAREPVLLQRYAEQGILTQASLMRKRKRHSVDANSSFEMSNLPVQTKKPKIPHRHGEFESRRDDIISRLRSITMADLEQKAQRLPHQFTLAIEHTRPISEATLAATAANGPLSQEQLAELLEPSLHILTSHSNMKPHLDNGMNQNGIYYNSDYFRLYLAFEQFQRTFSVLFPNEVVRIPEDDIQSTNGAGSVTGATERDKDRERNANMKAYRAWIEPLLTETNWAAFRRNIVVGERMMQLTKIIGQGALLMTKELSGSKLHLTFTNSEWDEFINGLGSGRWDQTVEWDKEKTPVGVPSLLVAELQLKFATHYWFYPDGLMVSAKERRMVIHASTVTNAQHLLMDQDTALLHDTHKSKADIL